MERTRIVVGVDGSAAARAALEWAVGLGVMFGAEIVAVHAVGLLEDAHDPDEAAGSWRAGLRDVVERTWCGELAPSGCTHRVVLRDGPPADVLLAAARDEDADLLIVGSRGVGATDPVLTLGSTSLRVVQAAHVPVLVVPAPPGGERPAAGPPLRNILVGVDRSEPSLAALELAADVAHAAGASMSVLEAFEYVPPFPVGRAPTGTSQGEEHTLETTYALLESEVAGIRSRGVDVQVVVRSGEPAPTLLEVAGEIDADLVVMGTRGRGNPAEPLLGSVARGVVHQVGRPTLVVPAAARTVRLVPAGDRPGRAPSGAET